MHTSKTLLFSRCSRCSIAPPIHCRPPRRYRRRAQTIVEFALVLPVLLVILLSIMEFGMLTKNNLTLANATREGVRTASLGGTAAEVSARIAASASPLSVTSPSGSIVMQYSTDGGQTYQSWPADAAGKNGVPVGSLIKITTNATHRSITGFFSFLNNRRLQPFVTMRREL